MNKTCDRAAGQPAAQWSRARADNVLHTCRRAFCFAYVFIDRYFSEDYKKIISPSLTWRSHFMAPCKGNQAKSKTKKKQTHPFWINLVERVRNLVTEVYKPFSYNAFAASPERDCEATWLRKSMTPDCIWPIVVDLRVLCVLCLC